MQDVGITLEGSQSNNVNSSNEELGKQKVTQKEGSDHVPVLSCPSFGGKSAMSSPWSRLVEGTSWRGWYYFLG